MMDLELYEIYTREEISTVFEQMEPTDAKGWFLSEDQLIGLFEIGERPPQNHFCDDSRFHWYGSENESVPKPLQDFANLKGGHLFIKTPRDNRYAYVSEIKHVGMYGTSKEIAEAAMDIEPRIPSSLLQELGGLYCHPDGNVAMDNAVEQLRSAATPVERFQAFRTFVEVWRGPTGPTELASVDR